MPSTSPSLLVRHDLEDLHRHTQALNCHTDVLSTTFKNFVATLKNNSSPVLSKQKGEIIIENTCTDASKDPKQNKRRTPSSLKM
jgi:hypothetical protein